MPLKDPTKRKEYEQKWRKEHIELCRKWRNSWNKKNPAKKKAMDKAQRLKFPWKKHYDHAKQRCTNPNNDGYSSYGAKGIKFLLTLAEVKGLYIRDNASNMIQASIDRKNTYGNYEFNNCRFIEFEENNKRPKRSGGGITIFQYNLDGRLIKEWSSIALASIGTNQSTANIGHVLKGKQKTAKGFYWALEGGGIRFREDK